MYIMIIKTTSITSVHRDQETAEQKLQRNINNKVAISDNRLVLCFKLKRK